MILPQRAAGQCRIPGLSIQHCIAAAEATVIRQLIAKLPSTSWVPDPRQRGGMVLPHHIVANFRRSISTPVFAPELVAPDRVRLVLRDVVRLLPHQFIKRHQQEAQALVAVCDGQDCGIDVMHCSTQRTAMVKHRLLHGDLLIADERVPLSWTTAVPPLCASPHAAAPKCHVLSREPVRYLAFFLTAAPNAGLVEPVA